MVVDPGRYVPPDAISIIPVPEFGHRISSSLPTMVLSLARSLEVDEDPPDDLEVRPLLKTSDRAWGETKLTETAVEFNEGEDHQGPLTVAVAINQRDPVPSFAGGQPPPTPTPVLEGGEPEQKGRLVVLGDADFAANGILRQLPTNLDLVINSVNWLAEEEELISIRRRRPTSHRWSSTDSRAYCLLLHGGLCAGRGDAAGLGGLVAAAVTSPPVPLTSKATQIVPGVVWLWTVTSPPCGEGVQR